MNVFFTFILGLRYPKLIFRKRENEKIVYLTFDDGPTPEVTSEVLACLRKYNALATFFCLGKNVLDYPDIFHEIIASGHSVGNHTYNHLKGWKTNCEEYVNDVYNANKLIQSTLFRPPYGRVKSCQITPLLKDFDIIMWDVLSKDYDPEQSAESCLRRVQKQIRPGSIVVFHDSIKAKKNVLSALPNLLQWLTENNYKCLPL
ncbi:MAG TPA: polysaccharide deacetylase family protein [Bacteroidales bacterium]|nr:MAG: hypothetical protein A2W98_10690 [Bacteroidetes bacterium GWF2_33_38]HBF87846.1 polysaccharide deacetylase family protein [Bacteroidales bacterium]